MIDYQKIIRRQLREMGKTKYWLATSVEKRTGIHRETVYRFMLGKSRPRSDVLAAILETSHLKIVPYGRKANPARCGDSRSPRW